MFDGVLANFTESFTEVGNKMYPGRVPKGFEPTDWNFNGLFNAEEQDKIWEKIKATQNFWLGLSPYYDNVGHLAKWLVTVADQDVYFVTSRVQTAGMTVAKQTDWWLRACGIYPVNNYIGMIVVPDSNKKAGVYAAVEIAYSIDDKAETVEQCDSVPDHLAYLLDRPWNQHAEVKRRVANLGAYLKEIR